MKIGSITLTRDSAWWGVSAVLSFAAVLATLTDPSGPMSLAYYGIPASWLPYIRLLGLLNTWVSGKMSNSPAASSTEVARGIRDNGRPIALLLAVGLALGSAACAGNPKADTAPSPIHLVTVSIGTAHATLSAVQDGAKALVCGTAVAPDPPACLPPATHRQIAGQLVRAFDLEIAAAKATKNAGAGNVAGLLSDIAVIIDRVMALIPSSERRDTLVSQVRYAAGGGR